MLRVIFLKILIEYSVLKCRLDDGDNKKIVKKSLLSICVVFVVHMNKNGANFKVKPEEKYVTCNLFLNFDRT